MVNLNDTPTAGPLAVADLDRRNTGRIYGLHRQVEPGAIVTDDDTEQMAAEACTELGADTRPAALSMGRHRRTVGRVALVLLIVPCIAAVVGVAAFAARHWPG